MCGCVVLGVRVPATSLFHDEKFAFFDFEVRGTPKDLEIFLGVPSKILKKVGVLPAGAQSIRVRIPPPVLGGLDANLLLRIFLILNKKGSRGYQRLVGFYI